MAAFCAAALMAQDPEMARPSDPPRDVKLPNGKSQSDEIVKADYDKNLKDLAEIGKLTAGVEAELRRNDRHVLSLKALKDLEEIEKLTRRVRDRMRRH